MPMILAHAALPIRAAIWRVFSPSLFWALQEAPLAINCLQASALLLYAATCKGVQRCKAKAGRRARRWLGPTRSQRPPNDRRGHEGESTPKIRACAHQVVLRIDFQGFLAVPDELFDARLVAPSEMARSGRCQLSARKGTEE